jgi:hypothetical protein
MIMNLRSLAVVALLLLFGNMGSAFGEEIGCHAICSTTEGICEFSGNPPKIIAACTRAIRSGKGPLATYYASRGYAYSSTGAKGDDDRAISDYTKAIEINPTAQTFILRGTQHYLRGFQHYQNSEYSLAVRDYTEAIRLDPTNASAFVSRADAYASMGVDKFDLALADCYEAKKLPDAPLYGITARDRVGSIIERATQARADPRADAPLLLLPPREDDSQRRFDEALITGKPTNSSNNAPANAPAPPAPKTDVSQSSIATSVLSFPSGAEAVRLNDTRIALVIGNSAYENVPALPNPQRDAKLVADVLKRTGFQSVTLLTDLKKDALNNALRNFAVQAETADWAVIYYAGHGMEVAGTNYLIPVDATIAADRDISFEAVSLDQVLNAVDRAKKLRLVILDACRDNPFKAHMKRTLTVASRSVSGGLAPVEPDAGTLVVYAAKDGQQAADGDGTDSPFTLAFVKNVQTPGLEVRRLFDYVRDDVMDNTGRQQQPFSYGSISGRQDFFFVSK